MVRGRGARGRRDRHDVRHGRRGGRPRRHASRRTPAASASVCRPSGDASLELRLAGRFNVHNALAVVALGEGLGLDPAAVRGGPGGRRGRPRPDGAHRRGPAVRRDRRLRALAGIARGVLDLLAPVAAARGGGLVAVFGSGGERDTAKRAAMGRIAGERCRLVVATDEDPRGEDRERSSTRSSGARRPRAAAAASTSSRSRTARAAIEAAFERARPGDVVLLAGKGHEPTILYADHALPWDEAAVARRTRSPASAGRRLMRGCLFTLASRRRGHRAHRRRRAARGRGGHAHGRGHRRGLQADDTTVTVSSDPPTDLIGLHADRVRIRATDATFRDLAIGALDLELRRRLDPRPLRGGVDGSAAGRHRRRPRRPASVTLDEIAVSGGGDDVTATTVDPHGARSRRD